MNEYMMSNILPISEVMTEIVILLKLDCAETF